MPLCDLTPAQKAIVHQAMRLCAERADLFPDWEFQTIFGVTRPQMAQLVAQWPDLDDQTEGPARWAVNNAMNNLLGYPHKHHDDWDSHFPFGARDLFETFCAWRGDRPGSYFDGLA